MLRISAISCFVLSINNVGIISSVKDVMLLLLFVRLLVGLSARLP